MSKTFTEIRAYNGYFRLSFSAACKSFLAISGLALAMTGNAFSINQTWTNASANSTWDTTSNNWSGTWVNGNAAIFNGTPTGGVGTVTVSGAIQPLSMTVSAPGYTFTGGTLTFGSGATTSLTLSGTTGATTINSAINMQATAGAIISFSTAQTLNLGGGGSIGGASNSANAFSGSSATIAANSAINLTAGNYTSTVVKNNIGTVGTLGTPIGTATPTTGLTIGTGAKLTSNITFSTGQGGNGLLTVNGGQLVTTNGILVAGRGQNSALQGRIVLDSGTINASDTLINYLTTLTTYTGGSEIDINGGTLTNTGTLVIGADSVAGSAVLNVAGGTSTIQTLEFGHYTGTASTGGTGTFTQSGGTVSVGNGGIFNAGSGNGTTTFTSAINLSGGTTYVGSGGIYDAGTNSSTLAVSLSGGTLGATANWSSALDMALTGNSTLKAANASNAAFNISLSGALTGTGGLTKTGAGTVVLSGANNYRGSTIVSAGTLQIGNGTKVSLSSSSASSVAVGATLAFDQADASVYSGAIANSGTVSGLQDSGITNTLSGGISGSGNVTQSGAGTMVLSGANTYTGTTTLAAGSITAGINDVAGVSGALGNGGPVTFIGGTLQYGSGITSDYSTRIQGSTSAISVNTNGNNITFASALASSNTAGLTKLGTGTLTLGGANHYSGATTLTGGTLAISSAANLNSTLPSSLVFNGGALEWTTGVGTLTQASTISAGRTATIQVDGSSSNLTMSGAIGESAASGSLTKTGTGTLTFTGDNVFTGPTAINAGVVDYNDSVAASNSPITVASGATAQFEDGINSTAAITISGVGASTAHGALVSVGANSVTGSLTLAADATISSDLNPSSGNESLVINGPNITGSGHTLTVTGVGSTEIDSVIATGTGGVTKTGSGKLLLKGANTYTGDTTVNSGTLALSNSSGSATGTGAVTVNGGTLTGSGNVKSSNLTVNTGGTLASGDAQTGPTVDGTHLTLTDTSATLASANLTFALGSGTTAGAGYHTFDTPNTNTTYLKLVGSTVFKFTGTDSISLVDLTNSTGSNGSLALRLGTPYLLMQAGSNADYLNLVINIGTSTNPIYTLSQNDDGINGWVVGVYTGSGPVNGTNVNAIAINQFGVDGVTSLTAGPNGAYTAPALYLDGGQLEVVPEPGTWAMMIGGLAVLLLWQHRRNTR